MTRPSSASTWHGNRARRRRAVGAADRRRARPRNVVHVDDAAGAGGTETAPGASGRRTDRAAPIATGAGNAAQDPFVASRARLFRCNPPVARSAGYLRLTPPARALHTRGDEREDAARRRPRTARRAPRAARATEAPRAARAPARRARRRARVGAPSSELRALTRRAAAARPAGARRGRPSRALSARPV